MTKDTLTMALGMWIALEPFLGFPQNVDRWLLSITGLAVVILGFLLRHDALHHMRTRERHADTFSENAPDAENGSEPNENR